MTKILFVSFVLLSSAFAVIGQSTGESNAHRIQRLKKAMSVETTANRSIGTSRAGNENCAALTEALTEYRDGGLLRDFDRAARKYQIAAQAKEDLIKIKSELEDTNKWQMSSSGQGFAQLMQFLVTTTNLIQNAIPATSVAKTGSTAAKKIYKNIQTIQDAKSIAESSPDDLAANLLLDLNPVVKTVKDLALDVKAHVDLDKDWKQYRTTVLEQVTNLNRMISKYEEELTTGRSKLENINEIKNLIDDHLKVNCSSVNQIADNNTSKAARPTAKNGMTMRKPLVKLPAKPRPVAPVVPNNSAEADAKRAAIERQELESLRQERLQRDREADIKRANEEIAKAKASKEAAQQATMDTLTQILSSTILMLTKTPAKTKKPKSGNGGCNTGIAHTCQ